MQRWAVVVAPAALCGRTARTLAVDVFGPVVFGPAVFGPDEDDLAHESVRGLAPPLQARVETGVAPAVVGDHHTLAFLGPLDDGRVGLLRHPRASEIDRGRGRRARTQRRAARAVAVAVTIAALVTPGLALLVALCAVCASARWRGGKECLCERVVAPAAPGGNAVL